MYTRAWRRLSIIFMNKFDIDSAVKHSYIWYKLEGNTAWEWPWCHLIYL